MIQKNMDVLASDIEKMVNRLAGTNVVDVYVSPECHDLSDIQRLYDALKCMDNFIALVS